MITQLKHIEKQIRSSTRIDYALNGRKSGSLSYLLLPAPSSYPQSDRDDPNFDHTNIDTIYKRVSTVHNGKDVHEWEAVSNREQVERLTLECMRKHFSQADGTPLTSPEWIERMNDEKFQNSIIDGSFDCNPYPRALRLFLSALHNPNPPKQLSIQYTFADFRSFIKNAKEKTSSSPSGRHYGHYKVLNNTLPEILEDIYNIMMLGLHHGVVLDRYKNTVTTLIHKDDGLPKIHRLRPIHIIESELQVITKSQWARSLLSNTESNHLMADSQYGGRAQRQAQSAILNKTLIYDVHRSLAKDFTSVDEDLKANFDRELSHIGALEDCFYGNSYQHGQYLFKTTTSQESHVKTSFGISSNNYSFDNDQRIWGLGQGMGWSGARWLLTSSTIDRVMNQECTGICLESPDHKNQSFKINEHVRR